MSLGDVFEGRYTKGGSREEASSAHKRELEPLDGALSRSSEAPKIFRSFHLSLSQVNVSHGGMVRGGTAIDRRSKAFSQL